MSHPFLGSQFKTCACPYYLCYDIPPNDRCAKETFESTCTYISAWSELRGCPFRDHYLDHGTRRLPPPHTSVTPYPTHCHSCPPNYRIGKSTRSEF